MPTTNPLILAPSAGTADALGNPAVVPFAGPLGGQNIAGVQVNPLVMQTQNDALASLMEQQRQQQQVLADALEAERLRLLQPNFDNVVGGVQSTEDLPGTVAPAGPPAPDATGGQMFGDALLGVASGIPALVELAGTLGGLVTGNVDNAITQAGRKGRESVQALQSDELKADRAARDARVAATEGEIGKAAAYITDSVGDINLFIDAITSNIATAGPAGLVGKMVAKGVAKKTAEKLAGRVAAGTASKEGVAKIAQQVGRRAGLTTAIGTGAVQQGMDVAGDVYFDSMADTDWEQNPDYAARVAAGEDPDEVKHGMSLQAAREAAPAAIALSAASQLVPGGAAIEKMFVGRAARDALRKSGFWSRVGGAARSALGEATQEAIEEGGGAFVGNVAQNVLAAPTALSEGVGTNLGAGVVGGLGLGGVAGATAPGPAPRTPRTPAAPATDPATGLPAAPAPAGGAPAAPGATVAPEDEAAAAAAAPAAPAFAVPPVGLAALGPAREAAIRSGLDKRLENLNKALAKNGLAVVVDAPTLEADPGAILQLVQDRGFADEMKALADVTEYRSTFDDQIIAAEQEANVEYSIAPEVANAYRAMNNKQQTAFITAMGWADIAELADDVILKQRRSAPGPVSPERAQQVAAALEAAGVPIPAPVAAAAVAPVVGPAAAAAAVTEPDAVAAAQAAALSPAIPAATTGRVNPLVQRAFDPEAELENNRRIAAQVINERVRTSNPLETPQRPKGEAAPAAAEGRQTEAAAAPVAATAPTPPANEGTIQRLLREATERTQNPELPRTKNTTSAQTDAKVQEEAVKELEQLHIYDGTRKGADGRIEVALATPTGNGSQYKMNIPGQPIFYVEDAQAARTALREAKFSYEDRSANPYTTEAGELVRSTMEQRASQPIRVMARGMRAVIAPLFGVERAQNVSNSFLQTMATAASQLMSRYTFVDQMEAGTRAATGASPRLGRTFRNALQRARSVGTRAGSPLTEMRQQIGALLKDIGSNEAEMGDFMYALHTLEYNPTKAGKKNPGTDYVIDENAAAFEWTGPTGRVYKGNEAANKFLESLPDDKRAVMERADTVMRKMVQDTLALQLQMGMISEETYLNLGGTYSNGTRKEGAFEHWVPLLTEGQEGFSSNEARKGRHTKAANPYVNVYREVGRMQRAAIMNSAWQEMYAFLLQNPDTSFARLNAQTAKPKDDELVWRRADIGGENTVWVWMGGERRSITFTDKLAQDFLKNSRSDERSRILNGIRVATQFMAGFRTAWNVAFVIPATAWDALMLGSSVQSAAGGTLTKEEAAAVTEKAFGHLLSSLKTIAGTSLTRKSDDAYYRVYEANGGGIAFGDQTGFGETLDKMRNDRADFSPLTAPVATARRVGSTLADLLHAPEAMFRFSAFKAYIEQKAGRKFESEAELRAWGREHNNEFEQALEMSRLITADFSDAGLSGTPRSLFMFFNAAMQGTRSLARLPQSERGRQALTIMVMAGAAAALIGAGDEDDKDVDGGSKYSRLKGRGRQIQFGEGFAIPLAPEMRMAYMLGNSMALAAMGKISWGKAAFDFGRSTVDTISPLRIPESDMPAESLLFTLSPSIAHPFITAFAGIDGFGRDTETEEDRTFSYDETGKRVRLVNPANYERGRDRDPQWTKDLARTVYDAAGIDLYPGRIGEVARSVFGGVYSFVDKMESDGATEATFRGFETSYDEFAVRNEFDRVLEDASQEIRRLQTNVNPLEAPSPRVASLQKLVAAEKALTKIRVAGYDENALYKMQRQALTSGDEAQIATADSLMLQLRAEKARIMGAAVMEARALGED